MNQQTLPFGFAASPLVAKYVEQLPDAPNCRRCGRARVTDWLGVHIHTATLKQTCPEETPA